MIYRKKACLSDGTAVVYHRPGSRKKAAILIAACVAAVLGLCAIGGTWAWLNTHTHSANNAFAPAIVTEEVHETVKDGVKSDVTLVNTGNVPAYLRATLVCTWVDQDGSVLPQAASLNDLRQQNGSALVVPATSGWIQVGNYYYYTKPVDPKGSTPRLIDTAKLSSTAKGRNFDLAILSEAIQAAGTSGSGTPAVQTVWPDVKIGADGSTLEKAG
jgi:hypothetical protein